MEYIIKYKYILMTQVHDMQCTKRLMNVGGVRFPRHGDADTQSLGHASSSNKEGQSDW